MYDMGDIQYLFWYGNFGVLFSPFRLDWVIVNSYLFDYCTRYNITTS